MLAESHPSGSIDQILGSDKSSVIQLLSVSILNVQQTERLRLLDAIVAKLYIVKLLIFSSAGKPHLLLLSPGNAALRCMYCFTFAHNLI